MCDNTTLLARREVNNNDNKKNNKGNTDDIAVAAVYFAVLFTGSFQMVSPRTFYTEEVMNSFHFI